MYYLQPQFPPACGPFCPGCRICCDVVFCDKVSTPETDLNNCPTKILIQVLEDVKKRTEFLQEKLSSFERKSIGTQVEKCTGLFSILENSHTDLATKNSIDSESITGQQEQKFNLLYDKSVFLKGIKSSNTVEDDSKEIMSLCLKMINEIKELREKLDVSSQTGSKNYQTGDLNTEKSKSLINKNSQRSCSSTKNCSKCKRISSCHRNSEHCCSRVTSCCLKNRRNLYQPCISNPRAFPHRRVHSPEEIHNTWCCWPFF